MVEPFSVVRAFFQTIHTNNLVATIKYGSSYGHITRSRIMDGCRKKNIKDKESRTTGP